MTEKKLKSGRKVAIKELTIDQIDDLKDIPEINFIGCFMNNIMLEMGIVNNSIGSAASKVYDNFINDIDTTSK